MDFGLRRSGAVWGVSQQLGWSAVFLVFRGSMIPPEYFRRLNRNNNRYATNEQSRFDCLNKGTPAGMERN